MTRYHENMGTGNCKISWSRASAFGGMGKFFAAKPSGNCDF